MSSKSANVNSSGDDQFIVFCFSMVSVALIAIYIPWIWGFVSRLITHFTSSGRRRWEEESPIDELTSAAVFIPSLLLKIYSHPGLFSGGAEVMMAQPGLAMRLYVPKFLKFIIRPKILVLWLWVVLFSSVMYTTLTFDAYAVLDLPSNSPLPDVKKRYRQLSKMYHPDLNSTEAAKGIYQKVVRAYKSIVKGDDDEDFATDEFSVGVGIPVFLTSHDNDGLVLFGMLGLMLAVPIGLYWRFRDSDKKVPSLVERIKRDKGCIAAFFEQLKVPVDPKYVEKKLSRTETLNVIKGVGLAPAQATETAVIGFPSFPVFVTRCINPENFVVAFKGLGFDDDGIVVLNQWAMANADKAIDLYEARLLEVTKGASAASNAKVPVSEISTDKYKAIRFLMKMHTEAVTADLEELQKSMPGELRACRKIYTIHREIYDLLTFVYEREKPLPRHVQQLIDVVRELDGVMDELIPDIEKVMRKYYKQYYEQQMGKRALKRMQRNSAQGGQ